MFFLAFSNMMGDCLKRRLFSGMQLVMLRLAPKLKSPFSEGIKILE